jgi:hypothetical protein
MSTTPKSLPPIDLKPGFARKLRCPRCAAYFETPKRWDLDCSTCGHRWQEVSVRGRSETVSLWLGDLADRVVMPLLLVCAFAVALALVAPFLYLLWRHSSFGGPGGLVLSMALSANAGFVSILWFKKRDVHQSITDCARKYYERCRPQRRGN